MNEREAERLFKALGNRRRIAILKHLARTRRASVGDVAKHIKLSIKATSKHLSALSSVGLLDREQIGLTVWYFVSPTMSALSRRIIADL
jgi:DNA-binding transcriptional ArsR family regulator